MNILIGYNWNNTDRCSAVSSSVQANGSEPAVRAIERQLDATLIPSGVDVKDECAGIAQARDLLRPHIAQVRQLAEAAQAR
ncbi:MAG TPA: hypothetical protein VKY22_18170 [Bradyrhizobium sp.]|nr:hypothetical protein [Bradyrhizobium sp.]